MDGRSRHGRSALMVIVLVAAMFAADVAFAHPDERVVDATLTLAPGELVSIPFAVHYHRLAATYRVHEPGAAEVMLSVVAASDALTERGQGTGEPHVFGIVLRGEGGFHHLIDCCLGATYSDYRMELRNDGSDAVTLDLRAWVVHDEFAVVATRAEVGALEVPLALFVVLGIASTVASRRRARSWMRDGAEPAGRTRAAVMLGWSVGLFGWACAVALGLAVFGAARYGGGPVDGLIAAMADVPVPGGPFGSRTALVMGVLLLTWTASIALWIAAVRHGTHAHVRATARFGRVLAIVSLAAGVAMGWTYGAWATPVGLGLVLAVPLWFCARSAAASS